MKQGWIGVDLDGTLALDEPGKAYDALSIGAPIPPMVHRVQDWLAVGLEVRVFTARVSEPDEQMRLRIIEAISQWCRKHIGAVLPVTNVKDYAMLALYDDRAVHVVRNTGECFGEMRGFSR